MTFKHLAIGGILACLGCSAHSGDGSAIERNIEQVTALMGQQPAESQAYYFFHSPKMVELFVSSKSSKNDITRYLVEPHSIDRKRTAVRLLQCLSIKEYISVIQLVSSKNAPDVDEVVYELINPGTDWGRVVYTAHDNKELVDIISVALKRSSVPKIRKEAYAAFLNGGYDEMQQMEGITFPSCE